MSRYKPDPVVRGDDWDPDESAVLRGTFSFAELQRIGLAVVAYSQLTAVLTEDQLISAAHAMAKVILATFKDVTLRKPETPYQEGIDRPKFDFSEEDLVIQPVDTLVWLANRASEHVIPMMKPLEATEDDITPTAKEMGLSPENFRPPDADGGDIPGGPDAAGLQPEGVQPRAGIPARENRGVQRAAVA